MAEGNSSNFEMKAHVGTYGSFLTFLKWGAIASAVVTAIVVLIIAS